MTPDTILQTLDNPQALNRYAYVFNDPINKVDPTGHMPFDMGFGGFDSGYSSYDYGYSSYDSIFSSNDISLGSYNYDWSPDWSSASLFSYDLGFGSGLDHGLSWDASSSYEYSVAGTLGGDYQSLSDSWSSNRSLAGFRSNSTSSCCSPSYSSFSSGVDSHWYSQSSQGGGGRQLTFGAMVGGSVIGNETGVDAALFIGGQPSLAGPPIENVAIGGEWNYNLRAFGLGDNAEMFGFDLDLDMGGFVAFVDHPAEIPGLGVFDLQLGLGFKLLLDPSVELISGTGLPLPVGLSLGEGPGLGFSLVTGGENYVQPLGPQRP
jgi:hypothetical protein